VHFRSRDRDRLQAHGQFWHVFFASGGIVIAQDEDEVWIVLDGEVSFFVADRRIDLHTGQIAHGPRGVPHSYLVRSETARLAVAFAPSCIEEWFSANGTPATPLDPAPAAFDIGSVVASAEPFHLRVAGPPPTG